MTKEIAIGSKKIGKDNPVIVQSMCNTKTLDTAATINQIKKLENAGCEMIRVAVPDIKTAKILGKIKKEISNPLIGDIHFDYRVAVEASKHCDKIRINPGNIGKWEHVKEVLEFAKKNSCAIRIGVNMGSLSKSSEKKFGRNSKAMVESALEYINFFENNEFYDIVVSLKSSDVKTTIKANKEFSKVSQYPLHIGITEAGTKKEGTIKSSVGMGALLSEGIGDTIRVSLTENPVEEIDVAYNILKVLKLREKGRTIISCPTCARTHGELIKITKEIEEKTKNISKPITIAVMGCEVNGPGEAKEADVGVALGKDIAYIFKKGKIINKIKQEDIVEQLIKEI
ncbi:MAG: flavodoxin-dependent (E)-4-hydroxy-3-methylbut-2-enyl-diphosphate synthase [Nanobdellota archaeon]